MLHFSFALTIIVILIAAAASSSSLTNAELFRNFNKEEPKKTTNPVTFIESFNYTGSAAVQQPGKFHWSKNFGYLDTRFKIPMPTNPSYMIGSNTKLFVAVSLYQLQERGKVKLHDNIADYITAADMKSFGQVNATKYCPTVQGGGDPAGKCQKVTFVQLLEMSAGIPGSEAMFLPFPGSMAQVVGITCFNGPLLFVPGTQYYYSNPSFNFAAWFVEKFSGMDFESYIKKNIMEPLRLESTYYDPYNGKFDLNDNRVVEYYQYIQNSSRRNLISNGVCSSELDMGSAGGAGGIISTLPDEATLYYSLFNFSENAKNTVLTRASLIEIVKPRMHVKDDPWQPNMWYAQGLGVLTASSDSNDNIKNIKNLPPTHPQVITIFYMGGTLCTHTANILDLRYDPPVLGQAFSNTQVFYPTVPQWTGAQQNRSGAFWDVTASWDQVSRHATLNIALKLIEMFGG